MLLLIILIILLCGGGWGYRSGWVGPGGSYNGLGGGLGVILLILILAVAFGGLGGGGFGWHRWCAEIARPHRQVSRPVVGDQDLGRRQPLQ